MIFGFLAFLIAEITFSCILDSEPPTAIPNRFRVPTKLETNLKLLSLIFSNNTA